MLVYKHLIYYCTCNFFIKLERIFNHSPQTWIMRTTPSVAVSQRQSPGAPRFVGAAVHVVVGLQHCLIPYAGPQEWHLQSTIVVLSLFFKMTHSAIDLFPWIVLATKRVHEFPASFSDHILIFPSVCLCALTLYPATDCAAATDISGVSGRWQLSR